MDNEKLTRAQQLVADNERTHRIVAGSASGIADNVGISFGKAGELGWIQTCIHAGENGESARGRSSKFVLLPEGSAVPLVGFQDFVENTTHDRSSLGFHNGFGGPCRLVGPSARTPQSNVNGCAGRHSWKE